MSSGATLKRIGFAAIAALFFVAMLVALSGCGGNQAQTGSDSSKTTGAASSGGSFTCSKTGPSLIPQLSGKPQLVYFFRDT